MAKDHRFINIQAPEDARSRRTLWSVRSQASRSSRSPARASRQRSTKKRQEAEAAAEEAGERSRATLSRTSSRSQHEEEDSNVTPIPSPPLQTSGNPSADPFENYPVPSRPYFSIALQYFVTTLAPHVPYIAKPGSRTAAWDVWWPRTMQEPALFLSQMLTAVSGLNRRNAEPLVHEVELLSLRVEAIQSLNQMLRDPTRSETDTALATVLHIAGHEVYFGGRASFETHLTGLRMMAALRGGFNSFDTPMRRALRWLESIQSFLPRLADTEETGMSPSSDEAPPSPYPSHGPSVLIATIHECLGLFFSPEYCHSRAFEKMSLLLVSLGVFAVEYYTDENNPSDTQTIAAECDSLTSELLGLEDSFEPYAMHDAYGSTSPIASIAAECIRIAMIATMLEIRRTVGSPSPAHRALNDGNRGRLARLDNDRLQGTKFEIARRYALGVLGSPPDRLRLPTVPTVRSNVPQPSSGESSVQHGALPMRSSRPDLGYRRTSDFESRRRRSDETEDD